MKTMDFIPGPTKVSKKSYELISAQRMNTSDIDVQEFRGKYDECARSLRIMVGGNESDRVVLMTGEGMLGLWGALHSTLSRREVNSVFVASNGFFGDCLYDMARSKAQKVDVYRAPWDASLNGADLVACLSKDHVAYDVVMMVLVETPSGTHNYEAMKSVGRHLSGSSTVFIVDTVSAMGGMHVDAAANGVDICLGASQKVLGLPPSLALLTVSEKAWKRIEHCSYEGYDALLPFAASEFPYTMDWGMISALAHESQLVSSSCAVLEASIEMRHAAASFFRSGLKTLGISLYVLRQEDMANTVTVAMIPSSFEGWTAFNQALRSYGMIVGSSWGSLQGKVFRVGHMSRSQCKLRNLQRLLDVLSIILKAS